MKDDDALLEWASVGPLEKETLSKIAKGNAIQRKGPDGGVELLAFQVRGENETEKKKEVAPQKREREWEKK